jgi:hypothetical protein
MHDYEYGGRNNTINTINAKSNSINNDNTVAINKYSIYDFTIHLDSNKEDMMR